MIHIGPNRYESKWWLITIILLAIASRMPFLWSVPVFSVEWTEILIGAHIAMGHALPWTDAAKDIGPVYNLLLAGVFRLFGVHLWLPRMLSAAASVATVLLAYEIARTLFDRRVALLSALMLACCGASVYLAHQAFSDSLTPLAVAAAGLWLLRAEQGRSWWLVPSAAMWAIALQTDSSVLALIIPVGLYLLWTARRRTWPTICALLAFFAGYGNMILYNIRVPLASVHWIEARKGYALSHSHTLNAFALHLAKALAEWGQTLGTAFGFHTVPAAEVGSILVATLWLLAFAAGVALAWRGRQWAVLVLILGPLLLIMFFNKDYSYPEASRYLVPLLPFAYALIAKAATVGFSRLALLPRQIQLAKVGLAVGLVLWPLVTLYAFESGAAWASQTNAQGFALARTVRQVDHHGTQEVLFDGQAYHAQYLPDVLRSMGLHVRLMGDPWANHERGVFAKSEWYQVLRQPDRGLIAVLSPRNVRRLRHSLAKDHSRRHIPGIGGGYVVVDVPAQS